MRPLNIPSVPPQRLDKDTFTPSPQDEILCFPWTISFLTVGESPPQVLFKVPSNAVMFYFYPESKLQFKKKTFNLSLWDLIRLHVISQLDQLTPSPCPGSTVFWWESFFGSQVSSQEITAECTSGCCVSSNAVWFAVVLLSLFCTADKCVISDHLFPSSPTIYCFSWLGSAAEEDE